MKINTSVIFVNIVLAVVDYYFQSTWNSSKLRCDLRRHTGNIFRVINTLSETGLLKSYIFLL